MVNVTKELKGDTLHLGLFGSIEESVNFEQLVGTPPAKLVVNCRAILRINSVGVKTWIKFFTQVQSKGTKIHFVECSTAIVEQVNLISNFTCGGSVDSVFVPFSCQSCNGELISLIETAELKRVNLQLPEMKCSTCGGKAVFDDIPEEYFGFITR